MRFVAAVLAGLWMPHASSASIKELAPKPAERPLQVQLVEDAAGELHTKDREAKADKHDAEDLLAQQLAADSADKQVDIALAALALSSVAAVGAFLSLLYTRRSLAQTAVSLDLASDTAKRQLRAYIGVVDVHARTLGTQHVQFEIKFVNAGQTPAHDVRQGILGAITVGNSRPAFEEPAIDRGGMVLVPGAEHVMHLDFDQLREGTLEDIFLRKKAIYVWGFLSYADIYGALHSVRFRYKDLAESWFSADDGDVDKASVELKDSGPFPRDFLTGYVFMPDFEGNTST